MARFLTPLENGRFQVDKTAVIKSLIGRSKRRPARDEDFGSIPLTPDEIAEETVRLRGYRADDYVVPDEDETPELQEHE